MPEGDSIHQLASRLRPLLVDRQVTSLRAHKIPDRAAATIVGQRVVAVEARGKNLLVRFDTGIVLHVHLKMNGRVFVERARSRFWNARPASSPDLRLAVGGSTIVGTRLPICRLLTPAEEKRALADLGPDLLGETFDENAALERLRGLGALEIGDAVMRQSVAAGIGNVYKSEVLFLERIAPTARVSTLSDPALRALLRRARALLQQNVGGGPRTTRATLGGPRVWVYGRAGRPCLRCGTTVATFRQGTAGMGAGRSTYHCPACQALP